jgi:hypothetical protein
MSQLHDDYLAGIGKHPDCLPAVDIAGVHEEPTRNKEPLLVPQYKIAGWQPRPFDLPASGIPLIRRAKKAGASADQTNGGDTHPTVEDDFKDSIPF